jgi:primase-polymerase (primpol)-like protein
MALCWLLAFWTGGDAQSMGGLFRGSGLYRDKWNAVNYVDEVTHGD